MYHVLGSSSESPQCQWSLMRKPLSGILNDGYPPNPIYFLMLSGRAFISSAQGAHGSSTGGCGIGNSGWLDSALRVFWHPIKIIAKTSRMIMCLGFICTVFSLSLTTLFLNFRN